MSFCINYWCHSRENPKGIQRCHVCGTPLILNNRYRVLRALRDSSSLTAVNYEVFEVEDLDNNGERKVIKTLVRSDEQKLKELFNREIEVLSRLRDPRIPKGEDSFTVDIQNPQRRELPCLVMEYIEGMNLDEWMDRHGKMTDKSKALDWLCQLTNILGLIHANKLLHRDIKPSNIMLRANVAKDELVLIDFGIAKPSETAANLQEPTKVEGSYGYTPREVQQGEPVFQSDFFALGRTFVYLLTGQRPDQDASGLGDWKWKSEFANSKLIKLIDDLMKEQPADRPQSAEEILHRIDEIRNTELSSIPKRWASPQIPAWLFPLVGGVLLLVAVIIISVPPIRCWYLFRPFFQECRPNQQNNDVQNQIISGERQSKATQQNNLAKDQISSGERPLMDLGLAKPYADLKSKGIEEFQAAVAGKKDYQDAIRNFEAIRKNAKTVIDEAHNGVRKSKEEKEAARNALKDAEVLIYLNNSKVRQRQFADPNSNILKIAVAAPVNLDAGLHILQGVAQAQNEVNKNQTLLEVVIANDGNNAARAKSIAQALALDPKILAVVGHYTTEVTTEAMKEYQEQGKGLVVVSPTSTSTSLSQDYGANHIFFRTASSTAVEGQTLANHARKINTKKIAVFRSNKKFSLSLTKEFTEALRRYNIIVIGPYDIDSNYTDKLELDEVKKADALAVFPDGQNEDSDGFNRGTKLINIYLNKNNQKKILGSNSLFLWSTLNSHTRGNNLNNSTSCRLIIGVDWVFKPGDRQSFTGKAQSSDYWGGAVNFRTANANDAVQVLVAAWQPGASRSDIQKKLSSDHFSVEDDGFGKIATSPQRKVSFSPENGDRNEIKERILVTPDSSSINKQVFVPLEDANCP